MKTMNYVRRPQIYAARCYGHKVPCCDKLCITNARDNLVICYKCEIVTPDILNIVAQ